MPSAFQMQRKPPIRRNTACTYFGSKFHTMKMIAADLCMSQHVMR